MGEFLLFDCECNGFYPNEIFVISVKDLITRMMKTYVGLNEIAVAIDRLSRAEMVVGHYINGYDLPVIKRLCGVAIPRTRSIDTVDLSRRLCPELPNHKLKTWGNIVDLPKLEAPLFEHYSPDMIPYCERDVDLNERVFFTLLELWVEENYPSVGNDELLRRYMQAAFSN